MARRRADPGAYTFDLEPDGDEEDVAASVSRTARPAPHRRGPGPLLIDLDLEPDTDAPHPAGPVPPRRAAGALRGAGRRAHELLRGRRLVAAVVLAAVALTGVVVDTVGDRSRVAALRTAPGGVLDLSGAPREVWRVEAEGRVPGGLVAASEGLVVAQHRDALLGIDVVTGERRWTVDLPVGTTCGPGMDLWSGVYRVEQADRVVCLTAPVGRGARDHARAVTVVDARGQVVGTRDVVPDGSQLVPGPDGGLLRMTWVGDGRPHDAVVPPSLTVDELYSGEAAGAVPEGYDLRVRLEDAATGEERWRHTVPFDAGAGPYQCVSWAEDGTAEGVNLRGDVVTRVRDRTIWVGGCGIDAWLTHDGDRLDRAGDPSTFEGFSVAALDAGGFVARRGGEGPSAPVRSDRLLSADGDRSRALGGRYLAPQSTDGSAQDVQLVRRDDVVVALDGSGEELWTAGVAAIAVPVRTAHVVAVVSQDRAVHGLDLATGEELWMRDDLFEGVDVGMLTYGPYVMEGAFTDGRLAAFVVPDRGRGDVLHWFALDVATGEDLWSVRTEAEEWGAHLTVDGHLVRWSPTEIVGLSSG